MDVVWGVGAQQVKMTTTGTVDQITDRYVRLYRARTIGQGDHREKPAVLIPLKFVVRYSQ